MIGTDVRGTDVRILCPGHRFRELDRRGEPFGPVRTLVSCSRGRARGFYVLRLEPIDGYLDALVLHQSKRVHLVTPEEKGS